MSASKAQSSSTSQLKTKKQPASWVWPHFRRTETSNVKECRYCFKDVKWSSPKELIDHMRDEHFLTEENISKLLESSESSDDNDEVDQYELKRIEQRKNPKLAKLQKKADDSLCKLVLNLPTVTIKSVTCESFRALSEELNPNYTTPSRKVLVKLLESYKARNHI